MENLKALFHCFLNCGTAVEKFRTVLIPQVLFAICVQVAYLLCPLQKFINFLFSTILKFYDVVLWYGFVFIHCAGFFESGNVSFSLGKETFLNYVIPNFFPVFCGVSFRNSCSDIGYFRPAL
jgi:hypothetical protein